MPLLLVVGQAGGPLGWYSILGGWNAEIFEYRVHPWYSAIIQYSVLQYIQYWVSAALSLFCPFPNQLAHHSLPATAYALTLHSKLYTFSLYLN